MSDRFFAGSDMDDDRPAPEDYKACETKFLELTRKVKALEDREAERNKEWGPIFPTGPIKPAKQRIP